MDMRAESALAYLITEKKKKRLKVTSRWAAAKRHVEEIHHVITQGHTMTFSLASPVTYARCSSMPTGAEGGTDGGR